MSELGDNLSVQDKELPPKRQGKNMGPAYIAKKTRRIMLEENADIPPTGLFVSINGYPYLIKPGIPFDCPLPVIEVLDNAILSVPVMDPNTLQIKRTVQRRRFSYQEMPLAN